MTTTIKLVGAPQSPYSRKMRAALRYRRIPFQWVRTMSPEAQGHPPVKIPGMVPVLWFAHEDKGLDTATLDSTFQLQHLETLYPERSLVPSDPVVQFFSLLLEDFADEWLTKCMFHYRWHREEDIEKAGTIIPLELRWDQPDEQIKPLQEMFTQRQVERLWVVGSNPKTVSTIQKSYVDVLVAFDAILTRQPFLLGDRPSAADFAFMGQLACLTGFDPSPMQVAVEVAPRVVAWTEAVEDLSGEAVEERTWFDRNQISVILGDLLDVIGSTYVPFLLANAEALRTKAERVVCEINDTIWEQKPLPYQGKCLGWIRDAFGALSDDDQQFVKTILEPSGCFALFSDQEVKS